MAEMVEVACKWCGTKKMVRSADVKRGWGKFCSKACKAKDQTKRHNGRMKFGQGKQKRPSKNRLTKEQRYQCLVEARELGRVSEEYFNMVAIHEYIEFMSPEDIIDAAMCDEHPFSSEALGQW